MVLNRKATGTASTLPGGVGLGVLLSVVITLLGACISAILIYKELITQESVGYCSLITLLLSAGIGAMFAIHRVKRLRMQVCLLTGLGYFLTLLCITALFFGGEYTGVGVTALTVLGGCGAVALMSIRQKDGKKVGKKKKRYC